jgi:hypothetical protein
MEELPQPTIWPAALAVGLVAGAFGMLTVGIFFYIGAALVALAAAGWIRDLLAEGAESHTHASDLAPRSSPDA